MKKRKLSKQQWHRVKKNQAKKILTDDDVCSAELTMTQQALVVQHSRTLIEVNTLSAQPINLQCTLRQNLGDVVVGDRVIIHYDDHSLANHQAVIESVLPRANLLARTDFKGAQKAIAANISHALIVSAINPLEGHTIEQKINSRLIDRYLVICENAAITPIILINKMDLVGEHKESLIKCMQTYQELGYQVIFCSVLNTQGISQLMQYLCSNMSILVGQSGVGKSSLLNQLFPQAHAKISSNSSYSGKGRHTTSAARLYDLSEPKNPETFLIDSPGIRELGMWKIGYTEVEKGFKEIYQLSQQCKFRDCRHNNEPGCAVNLAVKNGHLRSERLISFHNIVASLET